MAKASSKQPSWIFILGVVLAIIWGIFSSFVTLPYDIPGWLLIIIGIIIGFVNITKKEIKSFLVAGTVLIVTAYMSSSVITFPALTFVLDYLLALFAPAVIVVAIREVWRMAEAK